MAEDTEVVVDQAMELITKMDNRIVKVNGVSRLFKEGKDKGTNSGTHKVSMGARRSMLRIPTPISTTRTRTLLVPWI